MKREQETGKEDFDLKPEMEENSSEEMSIFGEEELFNNTHCAHCFAEINNSSGVCLYCVLFSGTNVYSNNERNPVYNEKEMKRTGMAKREIRGTDKKKRIKLFFLEILYYGVIHTNHGPVLARDADSKPSPRYLLNKRGEIERKLKKYMLTPGDVYFILLRIMNIKLRKRKRFNYFGITFYYLDDRICFYKINSQNNRIRKSCMHSQGPDSDTEITPEHGPVFSCNEYQKFFFEWYINPEHLEKLHFEDYCFEEDDSAESVALIRELDEILENHLEKEEDQYRYENETLTGYELAMFLGCDDDYYDGMSDDTMWDITGH